MSGLPVSGSQPTRGDAIGLEAAVVTVEEAFRAARTASGGSDLDLLVAGLPVRLAFAGAGMRPIIEPALAHLGTPRSRDHALTILAWDSASTGVPLPPPPVQDDDHAGRFVHAIQRGAGLFTLVDRRRALAVVWTEDAAVVPTNEVAAPLRVAFHLALAGRGVHMVHAGAVGNEAGGVLIAGRSGAGKSTATLACLRAGLAYAGDDYVLLAQGSPPRVHGLYASAKLEPSQLRRFPELAGAVANRHALPAEKAMLLLHRRAHLARGFPLRAVVVPRVTRGDTRLVPASPAEVLAAMAPSTIFQLPGTGAHTLRALAELLRPVPCYTLASGPDLDRIPQAILELLHGHARS